jgi:hypothetical protein
VRRGRTFRELEAGIPHRGQPRSSVKVSTHAFLVPSTSQSPRR